jgi:GNAT superfamily N-acetyltransferase
MPYYQDETILIRDMEPTDAQIFYDEYTAQGWHPDVNYYHMRMTEAAEGKCVALTAVYQGQPAGSVYLYFDAQEGPFKGMKIPEIVDFSVLQKYQRKGIGNRLMDTAEQLAAQRSDTVTLSVGLCREYGAAQRIYAKRGYIPDGSGVWYQGKQCVQYETVCTIDDDLVLFLSKKLRG